MTVSEKKRSAHRRATEFNTANPPGSPVLAWPGTKDQEPLRTRTRHGAWVLPAGDAVVSVVGHPGGIALTHIEPDPTRQPAVPDIDFQPPSCPICDLDLEYDGDRFNCTRCGALWGKNGTSGEWSEPNELRCPATRTWLNEDLPDEQCILADSHDADHHRLADGTDWTDAHHLAVIGSDGLPVGGDD